MPEYNGCCLEHLGPLKRSPGAVPGVNPGLIDPTALTVEPVTPTFHRGGEYQAAQFLLGCLSKSDNVDYKPYKKIGPPDRHVVVGLLDRFQRPKL